MDLPTLESVLITGADRGLGRSLSACFLRSGFRVFAGLFDPASDLSDLSTDFPEGLMTIPLDVTSMESVRWAAGQVSAACAGLDILINNAGVHLESQAARLGDLDLEDGHLERTMAVNAFGPLRVTRQFLPLLERGGRKLIVNISSEAGSIASCQRKGEFAYCMSKAALNMQSRILHNDLAPRGFRVMAVHPGWMRTDMGGPQADIHPDQAAEGIYALCRKSASPEEPMYVDYRGNPMEW